MRSTKFSIIAVLLVLLITGCGDSGVRSPGLSREEGNDNTGGNHLAQRSSSSGNSQSEPLDLSSFEPLEGDHETETPITNPQPDNKDSGHPGKLVRIEDEPKMKSEPVEGEQQIIEALRNKGANIRLIDGHAFSILLSESNSFNDTDCTDLSKLTHLQFLGLSHSKITNAGLERLVTLQQVTSIMLSQTLITDEGVASLKKMSKLAHININETAMTPQASSLLAEAFPSALITSQSVEQLAMNPGGKMEGKPKTDEMPMEEKAPEQPPKFPVGSPEEAVQKVAITLAEGKAEGLDEYISVKADKSLLLIRSNKVAKRKAEYYKQTFSKVQLYNKPRVVKDRCVIILINDRYQTLQFTCYKEDDLWTIHKFETGLLEK